MDIMGLLQNTLLSSSTLKEVTNASGASRQDASSVLSSSLPDLAKGLLSASSSSRKSSTLSALLEKVQGNDGSSADAAKKMLDTLLGGSKGTKETASAVSGKTGVSSEGVVAILTAAAPAIVAMAQKWMSSAKKNGFDLSDGLDMDDLLALTGRKSSGARKKTTAGKSSTAKKTSAKKTGTKKAGTKKTSSRKTSARKTSSKKTTARKASSKKAPAKKKTTSKKK